MPDAAENKEWARVVSIIDDYQLVINRGSEQGLKNGDRVLIYGIGEIIKDPVTGEDLGALEIVRGRGFVHHVQQKLATIKSSEKSRSSIKRTTNESGSLWLPRVVQEETPGQELPFVSPKVGDLAKLI